MSVSNEVEVDISTLKDLDMAGKVRRGEQINVGSFSDIYQGTLVKDGARIKVAIKSLRIRGQVSIPTRERLVKRFYREAIVWQKLTHDNIVPLLGYTMAPDEDPTLISPWYINGNIIEYIGSRHGIDRHALALDVVHGLEYLHSVPVAHGDLKGENVLVDVRGRASLCDFGMSRFIEEVSAIAGFMTSTAGIGGSDRFMSPDLLEDKPKGVESDIWALGCLVVQILTDIIPYQQYATKPAVMGALMRHELPVANNLKGVIDGPLKDCILRCWSFKQHKRPKAHELGKYLRPLRGKLPEEIDGSGDRGLFMTTGKRKPRYETDPLWTADIAPSVSELGSAIQDIDNITQGALTDITDAVLNMSVKERDWNAIVKVFSSSRSVKQRGEEHGYRHSYTKSGWDWFEAPTQVDSTKYRAVTKDVQTWFEQLTINDPDIMAATQINVDGIKTIVATTGQAISQLGGNATDKNYREISTVEFGILRYPEVRNPYFKLYCIRLFAWAHCQGTLFKKSSNGIRGVFLTRTYQPNEEVVEDMKKEVVDKGVAVNFFNSDD